MPKRQPNPRASGPGRTDAIAREAARLLALHRAADMTEALRLASDALADGRTRPPSLNRVRQHAQGMAMQSMGEAAYRQQHARWLAIAEELMTAIAQALPDADSALVGRAAEPNGGRFDADPSLHIRLFAHDSITNIARALAPFGYDDPDMKFTTMDSRHGRLSQLQWIEEGLRIVITRCPQRVMFDDHLDLVTGKHVQRMTLEQLRRAIAT